MKTKIKQITKYSYKNIEYDNLEDIKDEIHNTIGVEVIDKINRVCPPIKHKDLFNMLEVLCQPDVRKILTECYSVEFYKEPEEWGDIQGEIVNILDI